MGLIVKYHAVLENFDNAGAVVFSGSFHDLAGESGDAVEGAGEESALSAHDEFAGVERIVDGAEGGSLGHLAEFGGGAVLSFGQAVNFVVEDGDVEVLVAADGMDEVVATDSHGVAVAHVHPNTEFGVGQFHAGSDSAGAAVNAVETVGVDIIRNTGRASDAGYHADILFFVASFGERVQHRGKNGVVTASGAPLNHLVAGEISLSIFNARFGDKMSFCHNLFS